jgi:hypothetical protein
MKRVELAQAEAAETEAGNVNYYKKSDEGSGSKVRMKAPKPAAGKPGEPLAPAKTPPLSVDYAF